MSTRTILTVVLALVFGTSAAVGVSRFRQTPGGSTEETVPVVVASSDIPRFATVTSDMVTTREYPKSLAPAGAAAAPQEVIDRVTEAPVTKGEPVLDARLSKKGAGRGMSAVIPKGLRAVTIHASNVASGVGGFVLPGNRVDILFTLRSTAPNDPTGGGSTTTLVQGVEILAVNQRIDAPAENKVDVKEMQSVTLLVTPEQAAQIDLAQNLGTLHLALRNPLDTEPAQSGVATLEGIRFRQGKPWDERLKSLTAAMAKAAADFQEAQAKAEKEKADREKAEREKAAKAEKEKPPPVPEAPPRIRTLRGGVPGEVRVEGMAPLTGETGVTR